MKAGTAPIFRGIATAIVTPFSNGLVDFDTMGRLIDRQIDSKISAIVVCGTTGEASTLTHEEWSDCIKYTVDRVGGRIPVIAGSGSNSTEKARHLSAEAEALGADALMVVTPYYNKASPEGIVRHFLTVADAVSAPIILYNVPSRTGVNIPLDVYVKLSQHENIVAVKEASGDSSLAGKICKACGNRLHVYSGNDEKTYEYMREGALGCISATSNVAPVEMRLICDKYFSNETEISRKAQEEIFPLIDAMFCDVNPIPVKYALELMGLCSGELRLPLCEPCDASQERIARVLSEYGMI